MDINFTGQDLQQEISVKEQPGTYTVRKETTISHYEVSDGHVSWWEVLFFTDQWGTFKTAVQRYCGFNCTPYKDNLKKLSQLLLDKGVQAELNIDNYRLILKLDKKDRVRVHYAFKNIGNSIDSDETG